MKAESMVYGTILLVVFFSAIPVIIAWTKRFPGPILQPAPFSLRESLRDPILLAALVLGLLLGLHGIHWGRVESWHPDQMALRGLGELLHPGKFLKPPFHTYFNFFLSYAPIKLFERILSLPPELTKTTILIWSRFLTVLHFLGSVVLLYLLGRQFFGRTSARVIAVLFATSAGFIAFSHFLTADIPVMFWMLVAVFFSARAMLQPAGLYYVLAGLFTGIATATKYNGLAVGISIPVAHVLSHFASDKRTMLFDQKLIVGVISVPLGFLLGNPYALLDYRRFVSDFVYNYVTTPVYGGIVEGTSYFKFLLSSFEFFGIPASIVFAGAMGFSLYWLATKGPVGKEKHFLLLTYSVLIVYFLKFGAFPRFATRFALPVFPLVLLATGPFWSSIRAKATYALSIPLIAYGITCSFYVGKRFYEDPRMAAQVWVRKEVAVKASIESSGYVPRWKKFGFKNSYRMPFVSGRVRSMGPALKNSPWAYEQLAKREMDDVSWFSREALDRRNPDYVAVNSRYYNRFVSGRSRENYPRVRAFFEDLLQEKYAYRIVFDERSRNYPTWIYPRKIDFLHNRMTILKRRDS